MWSVKVNKRVFGVARKEPVALSLQHQPRHGGRLFTCRLLPRLSCGTCGRSSRRDYSQWIDVIQTRASSTAGDSAAGTERSWLHGFPLSNSGESNAMLENSSFAPPKTHFRTTARRTEHHKSAR